MDRSIDRAVDGEGLALPFFPRPRSFRLQDSPASCVRFFGFVVNPQKLESDKDN